MENFFRPIVQQIEHYFPLENGTENMKIN